MEMRLGNLVGWDFLLGTGELGELGELRGKLGQLGQLGADC